MRIALIALCLGAVGFLLRVLLALTLDWVRWRSGSLKTDPAGYNLPQPRRSALILEAEPRRRTGGTIRLGA